MRTRSTPPEGSVAGLLSVGFDAGEVSDSGREVLQQPSPPAKGCCHYLQPKVRLQTHLHRLRTHTHTKFSFIYTLERRSRWGGEKTLNCPHLCVFLGDSSLMNYELVSPPRLT